jgi:hypothetical protein
MLNGYAFTNAFNHFMILKFTVEKRCGKGIESRVFRSLSRVMQTVGVTVAAPVLFSKRDIP